MAIMNKARNLLGKNLKRLRGARGWTQADLAEDCGLSVKMIQKIEYGKTSPSLETLDLLVSSLKTSQSELFREEKGAALSDITSAADFLSTLANLREDAQQFVLAFVYGDPDLLSKVPDDFSSQLHSAAKAKRAKS